MKNIYFFKFTFSISPLFIHISFCLFFFPYSPSFQLRSNLKHAALTACTQNFPSSLPSLSLFYGKVHLHLFVISKMNWKLQLIFFYKWKKIILCKKLWKIKINVLKEDSNMNLIGLDSLFLLFFLIFKWLYIFI